MTLVVKIGGSAGIITGNIVHEIALCVAEGQRIVVLHGGSDLTNTLSEQLGHPVRMITSPGGMVSRYTDRETLCIYARSEERRVGKECRSRWSTDHYKKKYKYKKRRFS